MGNLHNVCNLGCFGHSHAAIYMHIVSLQNPSLRQIAIKSTCRQRKASLVKGVDGSPRYYVCNLCPFHLCMTLAIDEKKENANLSKGVVDCEPQSDL